MRIALSPTTVGMVVLSSPRRCICFSHTADHWHSLVVVQNILDEPPKARFSLWHPHVRVCGAPGGRRASVWLSRGFRRLVTLLPSLPPVPLYSGLPQLSLPDGTPQLSLLQELSTVVIQIHCGAAISQSSRPFIGRYVYPLSLYQPPPPQQEPRIPVSMGALGTARAHDSTQAARIFIGVDSFIGNNG